MPPAGSQPRRCRPRAAVSSPRMTSVDPTASRSRLERPGAHARDQHDRQVRHRRERVPLEPRRQLVDAGRCGHVLDAAQAERRREHAGGDHDRRPARHRQRLAFGEDAGHEAPQRRFQPLRRAVARRVARADGGLRFGDDLFALHQPDAGVGGLAFEQDDAVRSEGMSSEIVLQRELHLTRALAVLVTRPPAAVSMVVFGALKLGVLVRLKTSARNWSRCVPIRNCLNSEKSSVL